MPARGSCSVCSSPLRSKIEEGVRSRTSIRSIATTTKLSASAIRRHLAHGRAKLPKPEALRMEPVPVPDDEPLAFVVHDLELLHAAVVRGYVGAFRRRDVRAASVLAQQARLDIALRDRLAERAAAAADPTANLYERTWPRFNTLLNVALEQINLRPALREAGFRLSEKWTERE